MFAVLRVEIEIDQSLFVLLIVRYLQIPGPLNNFEMFDVKTHFNNSSISVRGLEFV